MSHFGGRDGKQQEEMEACAGRQTSRLKGKVGMKKWTGSLLARVERVQEEAKEEEKSKVCRRRERER